MRHKKIIWDLPFSQMEEELMGLAALYTYAINDGKEGNWFWHGMANLCVVEEVTDENIDK